MSQPPVPFLQQLRDEAERAMHDKPYPDLRWAHRIMQRRRAGERLSPTVLKMAEEALAAQPAYRRNEATSDVDAMEARSE